MVQDGDTVAIDSGTTTLELAKHLTHVQNLTVVTYDCRWRLFLERNPRRPSFSWAAFCAGTCSIPPAP